MLSFEAFHRLQQLQSFVTTSSKPFKWIATEYDQCVNSVTAVSPNSYSVAEEKRARGERVELKTQPTNDPSSDTWVHALLAHLNL